MTARRGHRALTVEVPSAAAVTNTGYAELLAAQLPANLHRPVIEVPGGHNTYVARSKEVAEVSDQAIRHRRASPPCLNRRLP